MLTKSLVTPYFTQPLFRLRTEAVARQYVNVSNRLDVSYRGRDTEVFVEVPAALFTVMRTLKVPVDSSVTLFLEEDGQKMLFGLVVDEEQLYDLWHYTKDSLPKGTLL